MGVHSKMWSKNYIYSMLVKDYRCTLTFAYIVPPKLRKIPKISPSKYKSPKLVTQKPHR